MNYIFKQIDNISGRFAETTVDFNADTITDVLEQFEMFLRGSGFYFTGKLDFVNDDDCGPEWHNEEFNTPKEETHEWTQTLRDDGEWPFSNTGSAVMDWTAAQLIRPPKMEDVCPICKIDMQTMSTHECWDKNCPKGKDAN